ncbi:DUF2975 domain-containing protein [Deinococcus aluminii]|uniref:DUF2975 domain-containing protein n=1 Tax=Deinococcus aluminii TaxID=1656885 RepID=A0ABP9XHZ3_9DEIO
MTRNRTIRKINDRPRPFSLLALTVLDLLTVLYVVGVGLFYLIVLFTERGHYGMVGIVALLLLVGCPLVAAWLFHLILLDARYADPFRRRNVMRLNAMGVLVLLPWLLTSGWWKGIDQWFGSRQELNVPDPGVLPVNGLTLALLLFGLAGVLARGVRLREEQELTV